MGDFDRSSKWLIQHHGDSLLRLAGVENVVAWRPLQAELVQPGQLPDGLLEVEIAGAPEPVLFVLELATYPEQRLREQLLRDMLLVFLDRRVLPEALALVLHPKGTLRIEEAFSVGSPGGFSELTVRWRIVELWTLPADELLATGDPGLAPWAPLARYNGPPEPLFRECRRVIDAGAAGQERLDLLAVTQVLSRLRYNDPQLLAILGGGQTMIESPLIQEIFGEAIAEEAARTEARVRRQMKAASILRFLDYRFGPVPQDVREAVQAVQEDHRLDALWDCSERCANLEQFRTGLSA